MRNIIAILRGITPKEVIAATGILLGAGISKIEIPLNSPEAYQSIELLLDEYKTADAIFGAGTVLDTGEVEKLGNIGAGMVVSPNCDADVIRATKAAGMLSYPGVMSPSECFTALHAGADGLKFFPGDVITPAGMKAMRAVLPADTDCLAVGGANAGNLGEWRAAGATGFGIGSALYALGDDGDTLTEKARMLVAAYDEVMT